MDLHFTLRSWLLASCLAPLAASAQDAVKDNPAPATCETRPGAPQWLPCGPDRVFTEAEAKAQFFKDGMVTKLLYTSGRSGKKFFAHFKPGGKLDSGPEGGHNVGKSWRFKGNHVCRDYYQNSDIHCAVFELQGTSLYLVSEDGTRSLVNSLEFAQP